MNGKLHKLQRKLQKKKLRKQPKQQKRQKVKRKVKRKINLVKKETTSTNKEAPATPAVPKEEKTKN